MVGRILIFRALQLIFDGRDGFKISRPRTTFQNEFQNDCKFFCSPHGFLLGVATPPTASTVATYCSGVCHTLPILRISVSTSPLYSMPAVCRHSFELCQGPTKGAGASDGMPRQLQITRPVKGILRGRHPANSAPGHCPEFGRCLRVAQLSSSLSSCPCHLAWGGGFTGTVYTVHVSHRWLKVAPIRSLGPATLDPGAQVPMACRVHPRLGVHILCTFASTSHSPPRLW
jgi:hypothetical protein